MPKSSLSRRSLTDDLLRRAGIDEMPAGRLADVFETSLDRIAGGLLIPLDHIDTWEKQPRKRFDEKKLDELARSIAGTGVLEPPIVRRDPDKPGRYIVIAGHRRILAARKVYGSEDPEERRSVERVACIVREVGEAQAFVDALVENLARSDLTRKETMDAFIAVQDEYGWGPREIARRTGRDHSDISQMIRIGRDPELADLVATDTIAATSAGHLLTVDAGLRTALVARIHAGELRTGLSIEAAIARAQVDTHDDGIGVSTRPTEGGSSF